MQNEQFEFDKKLATEEEIVDKIIQLGEIYPASKEELKEAINNAECDILDSLENKAQELLQELREYDYYSPYQEILQDLEDVIQEIIKKCRMM